MAGDTTELTDLVDRLVQERTFSLEAAGPIKDLRDKADALQKQVNSLRRELEEKKYEANRLEAKISGQKAEIEAWGKREADLRTREGRAADLEKALAVAEAKHQTVDLCFSRLFANRVVREHVQDSIPVVRNYGGSGGDCVERHSTTHDSTREEA